MGIRTLALVMVALVLAVQAPRAGFALDAGDEERVEATAADEVEIDYAANGTLYSVFVHHRRPAKAIAESRESRRGKSLLDNISTSVESDFLSRYVTHSLACSDGWVWQPSATIEWYGFGFNVWANFVIEDIPDQGKFNEVDLTLYYDFKTHNFTIHPYFVAYLYPTSNKLSLDYSADTDILPALHLAYSAGPLDIFADVQVYAHPNPGAVRTELGMGVTHKLPLKFGIEMSGLVGLNNAKYNRVVFNISETAFTYFTYSISFPWNPVKRLVLKPNAHVSAFFAQKFRDATQFPVQVWGGLNVAYQL